MDCILKGVFFGLEERPRLSREYVVVILLFEGSGPKEAERGGVWSWMMVGEGDPGAAAFFLDGDFWDVSGF